MEEMGQFFQDIWESRTARLAIGMAAIAVLILVLVYVVQIFRGMAFSGQSSSHTEDMALFRQMMMEGKIDEEDYQRLKSELSKRREQETINGLEDASSQQQVSDNQQDSTERPDFRPEDR